MEVHETFKTLWQGIHQVEQHKRVPISLSCWGRVSAPIPSMQQPVPTEHWVPVMLCKHFCKIAAPAIAAPQDCYVGRDLLGSSSPTLCVCFISFSVEVPQTCTARLIDLHHRISICICFAFCFCFFPPTHSS